MKIMFVYILISPLSVGATLEQHTVAKEDPRYLIVMVAGFASTRWFCFNGATVRSIKPDWNM